MSSTVESPAAASEDRSLGRPRAAADKRRASMPRLWPFLRPHRFRLAAGVAAGLIALLTAIAIPVVTARIIDGPIAHRDFAAAVWPVLGVFLLGSLDAAATWGRRMLVAGPGSRIETDMREALYAKLQALSVGVHDTWESGQLISRLVDDLSTLRRFVVFVGPFLFINTTVYPVGLVALFLMNWQIGLVQLLVSIPVLVLCARFERRHSRASRRSQDQGGDLATTAEESAQGIRVLKAFGRGPFLTARFTEQARLLQGTQLYKARLTAALWSTVQGLPKLALVFAVGYGGYAVATGRMTLGALVAGITLASFLLLPIIWTGYLLAEFDKARTAADRYFETLDVPVDIADPAQPLALPEPLRGELRLDSVRFGFPAAGKPVLDGVSMTVRPGEMVALVGATGSGKTALLNLIPRLYDVDSGAVTIDGVDIARLRVSDLRAAVSVAFEDPVLFSASVRENVTLGKPEAGDDEVWAALGVAHAADFVEGLPWGLDTRVGEQGMSLSGGQRQRLALARAVLHARHRPGVVVLDDPLSAVDVHTEEKVQSGLRSALGCATTLVVAHRPSTAALADRVVVLAGGRIVADGPHERLLATSGLYRDLMGGPARQPAGGGQNE
ncbi:MAG: ABC transporter ATP-binding protein [Mycobacteriaceae bacterium]|nr:ABC transporter ATP-binding protein [Mycobacteriaceae bacterium]